MLHMMVATHGPDTCPAAVPDVAEIARAGFQQMGEASKKLGITVQGAWSNMPAHIIYILVDAPNAHVVNQLSRDIHLMDWNTVVVNPVVTLPEAIGVVLKD
jgi:hypothetical protein